MTSCSLIRMGSRSWTNLNGAAHTVTASDKSFDSCRMAKGKTFSHTFTRIGKYDYICDIRQFMRASITVVQPYESG
jgi:plastocyanin